MLTGFVDIHCHILPGLDDGPATLDESLAMARLYTAQGVRYIVATPHYIYGTAWASSRQTVMQAIRHLQQRFDAEQIALTIFPGMEIACSSRTTHLLAQGELLSLGGNDRAFLLEPAFHGSQADLFTCVQFLLRADKIPVIAHPERIQHFQQNPEDLFALIKQGAHTQLTIDSLLAPATSRRYRLARHLIDTKNAHYLASDAHSSEHRKPPGTMLWQNLASIINKEDLHRLCVANPYSLLVS